MRHVDELKSFISALAAAEHTLAKHKGRPVFPFVTISRQAGAGGHTLAETLCKAMQQEHDANLFHGWQVLDQQLCEMLARDPRLDVSMQSLLSEQYLSQIQAFFMGLFSKQTDQNVVTVKLFELIRSLAGMGKVIVVGRAGSQVASGLALGVHVRLVAPERNRVKRMRQIVGQGEEEAKRCAQKQDQDRARLLKSYFSVDINDPLLYDVTWNTGTVPFTEIAQAIISLIKQRVAEHANTASQSL